MQTTCSTTELRTRGIFFHSSGGVQMPETMVWSEFLIPKDKLYQNLFNFHIGRIFSIHIDMWNAHFSYNTRTMKTPCVHNPHPHSFHLSVWTNAKHLLENNYSESWHFMPSNSTFLLILHMSMGQGTYSNVFSYHSCNAVCRLFEALSTCADKSELVLSKVGQNWTSNKQGKA